MNSKGEKRYGTYNQWTGVSVNFGMGFLRDVNKKIQVPVDNLKDVSKGIGLKYMIGSVMDGEVEPLVDLLDAANQGQTPRVTKELLDDYIDDPETDIDKLSRTHWVS